MKAQANPSGRGLIEYVQHFLLDSPRATYVKSVVVRQLDDLSHERPNLLRGFRFPLVELVFQFFDDGFHDARTVFPLPDAVNPAGALQF